jgi:hypothetical protein
MLSELAAHRSFSHFIFADAKTILLIPILHGLLDEGLTCELLVTTSQAFKDPKVAAKVFQEDKFPS